MVCIHIHKQICKNLLTVLEFTINVLSHLFYFRRDLVVLWTSRLDLTTTSASPLLCPNSRWNRIYVSAETIEDNSTLFKPGDMPWMLALADGLSFAEFANDSLIYRRLLWQRSGEIRLSAEVAHFLARYPDVLHLVLIVSDDNPDTIAIAPIVHRLAEASPRLALYIFRDEDDLAPLDALSDELELGEDPDEIDVPLLLVFDEEGELQEQWGPRPEAAETPLEQWLQGHPDYDALADSESDEDQDAYALLLDELTHQMRLWYNSGLNTACIEELCTLLKSLQMDDDGDGDDNDDVDDDGDDTDDSDEEEE